MMPVVWNCDNCMGHLEGEGEVIFKDEHTELHTIKCVVCGYVNMFDTARPVKWLEANKIIEAGIREEVERFLMLDDLLPLPLPLKHELPPLASRKKSAEQAMVEFHEIYIQYSDEYRLALLMFITWCHKWVPLTGYSQLMETLLRTHSPTTIGAEEVPNAFQVVVAPIQPS